MNETIIRIDLDGVNCYLVKFNERFILFDTGGPTLMDRKPNNRQETLAGELERAGCLPGSLELVVLTHGDMDHVFNAAYIRDKYNTKIALHHGDLPYVENPSIHTILESSKFRSVLMRSISKLMNRLIQNYSLKTLAGFNKFSPDISIDKSFSLLDFGLGADIIHTPGHTNGSICVLFEDGSLICGDTFANVFKPSIAINASNYQVLDNSVAQIKHYSITTIYPGHGKSFNYSQIFT